MKNFSSSRRKAFIAFLLCFPAIGFSKSLDTKIRSARAQFEEHNLYKAEKEYLAILEEDPCNEKAIRGLSRIADRYRIERKYKSAIALYRILLSCRPDKHNYWFRLGQLLSWKGQYKEAKEALTQAIALNPDYYDAEMQLGVVHLWQGNHEEGEKYFRKHSENTEGQINLGKLELAREEYEEAEETFTHVLRRSPNNFEARRGLARAYHNQIMYRKAKMEYEKLVRDHPDEELGWYLLYGERLLTDPSLLLKTSFTVAKEDDPDLMAPVVKTFYYGSSALLTLPVDDNLIFGVGGFYRRQKEQNIITTGDNNYNVYLGGAQIKALGIFNEYWRLQSSLRVKNGTGHGFEVFPFIDQTLLEPSLSLRYNQGNTYGSLSGSFDSFIIKNFSIGRSELLPFKVAALSLRHQFSVYAKPRVGFSLRKYFYEDDLKNIQKYFKMWTVVKVPFFVKNFELLYQFRYRGFRFDSPNYYSFKKQIRNTLGFNWYRFWNYKTYFEVIYEHHWQTTTDLITPIGVLVFASEDNIIQANRISGVLTHRIFDKLYFRFESSYYRSNFPYRSYGVRGELTYVF